MKQMSKSMYRVTTDRVVGFGDAVRSLGTHEVCGSRVHYTPTHVRLVLQGRQKSEKLLRIIADKCPGMFDLCKCSDDVLAWYAAHKGKVVA